MGSREKKIQKGKKQIDSPSDDKRKSSDNSFAAEIK